MTQTTSIEFATLGLTDSLQKALKTQGYAEATPIQAEAIPLLLDGHDLVGIAQTGTGKTAAFLLPLLNRIAEEPKPAPKRSCKALILAPTRELANQIAESARVYGHFTRPTVAVVVGGVNPRPQIRAVEKGVDLIIATPGRLLDHVGTGAIRLNGAKTVVLDEADQMMDMGFIPAIRKVMEELPTTRQTVLLSATMPRQVRALADDFLTDPEEVSVAPQSRPVERIEQSVVHLPKADKRAYLIEYLRDKNPDKAIVFTRTKHGADRVSKALGQDGIKSGAIHGNKSQGQREKALAAFRKGKLSVLVATDIAARGIDIDDVSHVVNYELPNVPESYVHRIGRTARAGKSGVAVSLCDGEEFGYLRDIERLIGIQIEGDNRPADPEPAPGKPGKKRARPNRQRRTARAETQQRTAPAKAEPRTKPQRAKDGEGRNDGPRDVAQDRPTHERPQTTRTRNDRPQGEKPRSRQAKSDRPRDERRREERRREERQRDDRPRSDRPKGNSLRENRSRDERQNGDRPHRARSDRDSSHTHSTKPTRRKPQHAKAERPDRDRSNRNDKRGEHSDHRERGERGERGERSGRSERSGPARAKSDGFQNDRPKGERSRSERPGRDWTKPKRANGERSHSERSNSERSKKDWSKSDRAKPGRTKPDRTKAGHAKPARGKGPQGKPAQARGRAKPAGSPGSFLRRPSRG